MSKWYGLGGNWINKGLPQYAAINRKPENGCEIQNICCACSCIMMQLKIVETTKEENANAREGDDGLLHGTSVLKNLLRPWWHDCNVVCNICANSYFASVGCLKELESLGF